MNKIYWDSGDGGNRTHVRKIRSANIYECSRLLFVARLPTTDKRVSQTIR
jgi:hypothetical protein